MYPISEVFAFVNITRQLTQASVIIVALTSADAISVFADSLHFGILASTIE